MSEVIRRARADDAETIRTLGLSDSAFQVSERIPFYEREELVEWATAPQDNLLFVAESKGNLTGFFFCKVISQHWAMLDNFYVVPLSRGTRTAERLRRALVEALRERGIVYLSTIVAKSDSRLSQLMIRYGFTHSRDYAWMEMFLEEQEP